MSKRSLFSINQDKHCPQCGAKLLFKTGRSGTFLGCENYPQCTFTLNANGSNESHVVKVLEGHSCPKCGASLTLRRGRHGMFICCDRYPECHFVGSDERAGVELASCPQCRQGSIIERCSRFGNLFYTCNNYPKCQFMMKTPPIVGECPHCGFELLTQVKNKFNVRYICANKQCGKTITEEQ